MADKPILFSGPMVQALLDGRKTQTRRALRLRGYPGFTQFQPCTEWDDDWMFRRADAVWESFEHDYFLTLLPFQTGDRLWVREAWKTDRAYDDLKPSDMGGEEPLIYEADNEVQRWGWQPDVMSRWGRYRHARFMPRWASRLTLNITDVRLQRLQEISEEDAIAEGIPAGSSLFANGYNPHRITFPDFDGRHWDTPSQSFESFWNSINGPDAWAQNPFVAVYSFTVERRNIDTPPPAREDG